jgi:hypothetical protein
VRRHALDLVALEIGELLAVMIYVDRTTQCGDAVFGTLLARIGCLLRAERAELARDLRELEDDESLRDAA